jgi:hypothetical protein
MNYKKKKDLLTWCDEVSQEIKLKEVYGFVTIYGSVDAFSLI